MDTHSATTAPTPFPPLVVGHDTDTAAPVVFDPHAHGHALVVARRGGGLSTVLHRLALQAHTGGADVQLFSPATRDPIGLALQVKELHTAVTPHAQDNTAEFFTAELEARQEQADADGVQFTHGSLFLVVDDMEAAEESLHALVRRVLDEGAAVGVHALIGSHADPMGGYLAVEGYQHCGFRLVRETPLSLVRRILFDNAATGLVPAPSSPGLWVARTGDEVVTVRTPY